MKLSIEDITTFCKKKGFVYQNSEIYGGIAGFWDYGPYGVELKNNIKQEWWKYHVTSRPDVVGIDGSIINHPKVWEASGHVECFEDPLVEDKKTGEKFRADTLIEKEINQPTDGLTNKELWELIKKHKIKSPKGNPLKEPSPFNMMFSTQVGPKQDTSSKSYLRPETAQVIFTNFKLVAENARLKLPFGIAQIGKVFRNEISPRDFLFRLREFEQMELEYFVHPDHTLTCPFIKEVLKHKISVYSAVMQKRKFKPKEMSMEECIKKKIIKTEWHAYWLAKEHQWFINLGANKDNFRIRQHVDTEKSHYALDTWDLEYEFPFGWKELQGMANRTDFDLKQHMKHSKEDLSLYDEEKKQKIIPHVVCEPSQGVSRAFLVFMFDAYQDDKERGNIVLHLNPKLAPVKLGIFPLSNKLKPDAEKVYKQLSMGIPSTLDTSGSIGRRYARADELGIPYCITVDFTTKEDNTVTVRDRESTEQIRIKTEDLPSILPQLLNNTLSFEKAGKFVK
jgi:glycyl-tRNA synthetase